MDERRLTDEELRHVLTFAREELSEGDLERRAIEELVELRASRARAGEGDGFAQCSECGVVIHCAGTGSPHPDLIGAARDLLREVRHVPGLSSAGAIRLVEAAQRVERILRPPSAGEGNEGTLCACGCGRTLVDSDRPGRLAYPCRVAAADAFVKAAAAPPPEEKP